MINHCKLVAVGDYCGKTFVIDTFIKEELPEPHLTFVSWGVADVEVDGVLVELQIWDTCSKERFEPSRIMTFKNANVFLIFFSVFGHKTFENIKTQWVPEIKKHGPKNVPFILVGTLHDDIVISGDGGSKVSVEEIEYMAKDVSAADYVVCYPDTKYNIDLVFEKAVAAALKTMTLKNKR